RGSDDARLAKIRLAPGSLAVFEIGFPSSLESTRRRRRVLRQRMADRAKSFQEQPRVFPRSEHTQMRIVRLSLGIIGVLAGLQVKEQLLRSLVAQTAKQIRRPLLHIDERK